MWVGGAGALRREGNGVQSVPTPYPLPRRSLNPSVEFVNLVAFDRFAVPKGCAVLGGYVHAQCGEAASCGTGVQSAKGKEAFAVDNLVDAIAEKVNVGIAVGLHDLRVAFVEVGAGLDGSKHSCFNFSHGTIGIEFDVSNIG